MDPMPYDPELVAPMRREMTSMGVRELTTAADVRAFLADSKGTALVFVNSVCGCAAGSARPGLKIALGNDKKPAHVGTVFAGQDVEATQAARQAFAQFPPSSPSAVLFKDGEPVFYLPRHMIEGRDAPSVAFELVSAFDEFC
jgi:putative YphP/YqiW family bacilliredoxin